MKTKVLISIDTEFSIGGAFDDPAANKPLGPQIVLCEIAGKSHALGFLLETFEHYAVEATFFVEALNTNYFGDEPMRELATLIAREGHDVQLHLHPCWTYFKNSNWRDTLRTAPPSDHMHGRSLEQLVAWMREGISTFQRWGIGTPVALRTGNMMVDSAVYRAMHAVGLRISSNVAWGIFQPPESDLRLLSGIHRVGNVMELCVLSYVDVQMMGRKRYRSLTTTGSSWGETRALLIDAHDKGVESVVLLTHPFEYVISRRPDFADLCPNRVNQERLSRLCEFLRDNQNRFEVTTFGALGAPESLQPSIDNIELRAPWRHVLGRMLENGLGHRVARR